MGSNVINIFDIRRAKAVNAEDSKAAAGSEGSILAEAADAQKVLGNAIGRAHKDMWLVFANDFVFQSDFLNLCKVMMPGLVVDLRVAPRLDFVRPTREQAFELFDTCGIAYRDVLGRLNATTYDLTQERFEEVISAVESLFADHDGPALGLFDNATFAQFFTTKLSHALPVTTLDADAIRRMAAEGARERM